MGNITKLKRKGHLNAGATTFGQMDDLTYSYIGNQLQGVSDLGSATGFLDGNTTGTDYEYDSNGNLEIDRNKGITEINYNHLNLPEQVTVSGTNAGTITYVYAADGTKLKKTVSTGAETLYANGYVYEGNILQFFPHAEGYVTPDGNGWRYVYQYKDRLNNIRLSYTEDPNGGLEIVEDNAYYPFGIKMRGFNGNVSSLGNDVAQRWKFGGKEFDESFNGALSTYDFGARHYDPALGRWFVIDPKADDILQVDITPYNYSWNNPTNINDPDGECPWCWGAAIGALVEAGSQIATNMIQGDSFVEAVGNIDYERVAVATVTGALTGGLSSIKVIGAASKVYKGVATSSTAAGGSIVTQGLIEDKKTVNPGSMMMDAVLENVKLPEVKLPEVSEKAIKAAEKNLDRAERVAGENPRPSRAEAVKESKKEVQNLNNKQENTKKAEKAVNDVKDAAAKEAANQSLNKALEDYRFKTKQ